VREAARAAAYSSAFTSSRSRTRRSRVELNPLVIVALSHSGEFGLFIRLAKSNVRGDILSSWLTAANDPFGVEPARSGRGREGLGSAQKFALKGLEAGAHARALAARNSS
jgi:hypothetical protein